MRPCKQKYRAKKTWFPGPSVKYDFKKGGAPPPNHSRRCQSHNREKVQCGRWALKGREFCKRHGGKTPLFLPGLMGKFYSQHAGPKLRELMEKAAAAGDERLLLDEEIDFSRTLALRSIQLFETACLDETESAKTSVDLKAAAIAGARNAMSHIADLVMKAAKIRALDANSAIAPALDFVVQQVVKAVEDEVAVTDPILAKRLTDRLRDIRLPENTNAVIVIN